MKIAIVPIWHPPPPYIKLYLHIHIVDDIDIQSKNRITIIPSSKRKTSIEVGRFPAADPRSHDIPIQRKDVDPVRHPYRFFDTHYRLFADAERGREMTRAHALRSHELREKHYDIVSHCSNSLDMAIA